MLLEKSIPQCQQPVPLLLSSPICCREKLRWNNKTRYQSQGIREQYYNQSCKNY